MLFFFSFFFFGRQKVEVLLHLLLFFLLPFLFLFLFLLDSFCVIVVSGFFLKAQHKEFCVRFKHTTPEKSRPK